MFHEDGAQRVRWAFPSSAGERMFRSSYDVAGAVRRSERAGNMFMSCAAAVPEAAVSPQIRSGNGTLCAVSESDIHEKGRLARRYPCLSSMSCQ